MFGNLKKYMDTLQNRDRLQNGPKDDPDNGGLIEDM